MTKYNFTIPELEKILNDTTDKKQRNILESIIKKRHLINSVEKPKQTGV